MDDKLARVRELIEAREKIDAELSTLIVGYEGRKKQRCGHCGAEGHNAKTCPSRQNQAPA